jgi:hypothetical protein
LFLSLDLKRPEYEADNSHQSECLRLEFLEFICIHALGTYVQGHLRFITFYVSRTKEIQTLMKVSVSGCMRSAKERTLVEVFPRVLFNHREGISF